MLFADLILAAAPHGDWIPNSLGKGGKDTLFSTSNPKANGLLTALAILARQFLRTVVRASDFDDSRIEVPMPHFPSDFSIIAYA